MNRLKSILEFFVARPTPIIIGAVVLAFIPLLFGSLTARDERLIWNEPSLSGFAGSFATFGRTTPPRDPLGHYRPISTLSLNMEVDAEQESALLPRLSNLILLALIAALLYQLLKSMNLSPGMSAWAVALFAVHPTHIEVVATLAGRAPLSAHVFALSAILFSLKKDISRNQKAVCFAFMFLAVLCQRSAATWCLFPAAALLARGETVSWKALIPRPLMLGALSALVLGILVTGSLWPAASGKFLEADSLLGSIQMSLAVIGKSYPALLLVPSAMTPDPLHSNQAMQSWLWAILGLAVIGGLIALMVRRRKQSPFLFLASWLFLIGVLPTLPFFDGDLPSQRSVFAATFALPFLFAFLLSQFGTLIEKRRYVAILPILLAVLTGVRAFTWHNEEILMTSLPSANGPLACGFEEIQITLRTRSENQRVKETRELFTKSIEASGTDQRLVFAALTHAMNQSRDFKAANDLLTQLEAERPSWPGTHSLRGQIALGMRDPIGAHNAFEKGRNQDPLDPDARWFLGLEYAAVGSNDLAEALWREGLRLCTRLDQQTTAMKILNQLAHLLGQQTLDPGLFRELCRRQLRYNPKGSKVASAIEGLMDFE
ncbi:MAG: tetratricopeptide (TPR) repeat protein [Planctomycetota bacterium]|jgi:tetratricopeptide (TPR) repeat protein